MTQPNESSSSNLTSLEEHDVTELPPPREDQDDEKQIIPTLTTKRVNLQIAETNEAPPSPFRNHHHLEERQQRNEVDRPGAYAIQPGNTQPLNVGFLSPPSTNETNSTEEEKQSEDHQHHDATAASQEMPEAIVAELVTDTPDNREERRQQEEVKALKRWVILLVVLVVLALVAIGGAVGGILERFNNNNSNNNSLPPDSVDPATNSPSEMPSFFPSNFPSSRPSVPLVPSLQPSASPGPSSQPSASLEPSHAPSMAFEGQLISLIRSRSLATTFEDPSSPQSLALDWLVNRDEFSQSFLLDRPDRLVQRFALVTLWYATGGPITWDENGGGWLNPTFAECDWNSVQFNTCLSNGLVSQLLLFNDGLSGSLPIEVGLLTTLTGLSLASNAPLVGTLPSELGQLTVLERLAVSNNELSGTLPSELGQLTALTFLNLFTNKLTGSIPTELERLTNLDILFLYDNELVGTLPSGLCNAGLFGPLRPQIDCAEIVCDCCDVGTTSVDPDPCP